MKFKKSFSNIVWLTGAGWLACAVTAKAETELDFVRAKVRVKYPSVQQISTAKLATWLADTNRQLPILLDVRTEGEYAVSHLPGARRVDARSSAAQVSGGFEHGGPVVAYCSVGYRSSQIAERLQRAGLTNVFNLDGSIFQWANEGRPLEQDGHPTKLVHSYNTTFGKLLREEYRAHVPPVKE